MLEQRLMNLGEFRDLYTRMFTEPFPARGN